MFYIIFNVVWVAPLRRGYCIARNRQSLSYVRLQNGRIFCERAWSSKESFGASVKTEVEVKCDDNIQADREMYLI